MGRRFHIGDVLTVTTGCLLSERGMEGVYDILNFLTGDNLFTHQLPRAARECRPHLLRQFPQLAAVSWTEACGVNVHNHREKLAGWASQFGETLEVEPVPTGAHEQKDPVTEAVEMAGAERVIVVQADSDEPKPKED